MAEEVGFLGKIFGPEVEEKAKKKTIKLENEHPLYASEFKKGKRTWAYLITKDKEEYKGKNVAIIVQIAPERPILRSVTAYLENNKIKAHIILITNKEDPNSAKPLDDHDADEWHAIVQDLREVVTEIQTKMEAPEFHFFFTAPAALTMAFGVVFGNFWNAHVYNWVKRENTYAKVLKLPIC
jgi:hypothetical protein